MVNFKQRRGITLIALVITIIVLLILAGITINLIIGQDGIMNMAQKAGKNHIEAEEQEKIEIAKITNEVDKYIDGNRNVDLNDDVKNYIDNKLNKSAITVSSSSLNTALTTTITKYPFNTVDTQKGTKLTLENGEVKIGEGINYVLISSDIYLSGTDQGIGVLRIYKNDSQILEHHPRISSTAEQYFASTAKVISVTEGDTLSFWSNRGGAAVNLSGFSLTVVEL